MNRYGWSSQNVTQTDVQNMSYSYEEIRAAAFSVLGGQVPRYTPNQYIALSHGVAAALGIQSKPAFSYPSGEPSLAGSDADIFLEVFWDLFREGVITIGLDDSNREFPFFRLTTLGKRIVHGENSYFIHDVSSYEKRILNVVPKIDPVTLLYLKEALQAFRSGCILSATVMLGVAAEHTFLLLIEKIEANPEHSPTFAPVGNERTLIQKVNKFNRILEQIIKTLPSAVKDDLETNFSGILSIIRTFRNQSGHPSGKIIDREQAYVLLGLFPHYCKKMYQLIDHFS